MFMVTWRVLVPVGLSGWCCERGAVPLFDSRKSLQLAPNNSDMYVENVSWKHTEIYVFYLLHVDVL